MVVLRWSWARQGGRRGGASGGEKLTGAATGCVRGVHSCFLSSCSSPHHSTLCDAQQRKSTPVYPHSIEPTPAYYHVSSAMITTVLSRFLDTAKRDFVNELATGKPLENWVVAVGNEAGGELSRRAPRRTRC